ncbi:MAG: SMC-Scp complex subunit ScpB [Planctomycetota bacterium]|jgi:segregation and condensation protein B
MPERIMDEAVADEAAKSTPGNHAAVDSDARGDDAAEAVIEIQVDADAASLPPRRGRPGRSATAADAEAEADTVTEAEAVADTEAHSEPDVDGGLEAEDGEDTETVRGAAGEELCHQQALSARVEALLLASDRPMTEARLADICGLPRAGATARIRAALTELTEFHRASGRSFRPRKVAGGWQLVTLPAFGPLMARLHRDRQETRLSPAAMETLSIIAYRQPVLRAELEAIRGVACGEVLRSLMERRLVSIVGRSEDLGRPMLYGTTRQFLEVFGLSSLEDLPEVPGLERRRPPRPVAATPAEESEDVIEAGEAGEPDPGAAEAPEGSGAGLTPDAGAGDGADEVAGVTPESGV